MSRDDVFMQRGTELSNDDRCQLGGFCSILIADVIQTKQSLVLAEMKGCQPIDWNVGE